MAYRLVLFACSWLFYKDECFLFCVLYALDTLQTYKQLTDSRKGQTENDLQRGLFFLNTSKVVQVLLSLPPSLPVRECVEKGRSYSLVNTLQLNILYSTNQRVQEPGFLKEPIWLKFAC